MRREQLLVIVSLLFGFMAGVVGGFTLAGRQVDRTKIWRDMTAIQTSVVTLEMSDKGDLRDIRQLHVHVAENYAKEATEKAERFRKNQVRDQSLIAAVGRGEAWAHKNGAKALEAAMKNLSDALNR